MNEEIREREVRLIYEGEQIGIVSLAEALRFARERDLDLVEVASQAQPPVCRVMDYGKHKYQEAQKQKEARKRQNQIVIKEIKMRPKISENDYRTKSGHVLRFLKDGAKVKATIMFRGREQTHPEIGRRLLERLAEDMQELSTIEASPTVDGRNMVMVLAPRRERARPVAAATASDGAAAEAVGAPAVAPEAVAPEDEVPADGDAEAPPAAAAGG
ncbi:MAG: translation initiation factor IF-3 [Actinobacteria bacterium]|nr:translation initiation factor IF-3 [Actinomycetota bacterium]